MTQFRYDISIPVYHLDNREHKESLVRCIPVTFREIVTDAPFEALNYEAMEKSAFLFGDKVAISDEVLFEEQSKWLHQVETFLCSYRIWNKTIL